MAASAFILYNKAIAYIGRGIIDLDSATIYAVPLRYAYTPSTASHSDYLQIFPYICTASGNTLADIQLASKVCINSGGVATKFDSADISGFSAGGAGFHCKYVSLFASSASGAQGLLLGFIDTDTSTTTGVEVTQLNITVPAGGWFKINSN